MQSGCVAQPCAALPSVGFWTWGLHTATCSSPPDERQRFLWAPHPEKVPDLPCSVFAGMVRNGSGGLGELRGDSHQGRACLGLNACLRNEWGHGPYPSVPQWWGNTSRALDQTYLPASWDGCYESSSESLGCSRRRGDIAWDAIHRSAPATSTSLLQIPTVHWAREIWFWHISYLLYDWSTAIIFNKLSVRQHSTHNSRISWRLLRL